MKINIIAFLMSASLAGACLAQTIGNNPPPDMGNGSAVQSGSGPVKSSSAWAVTNRENPAHNTDVNADNAAM